MSAPFELDDDLRARVDRIAERRQQSSDEVMREAIDDYVSREEAEQDDFLKAALASEEDFENTGLHLTFEEVEEWLKTWGTDHEKPMPACHR